MDLTPQSQAEPEAEPPAPRPIQRPLYGELAPPFTVASDRNPRFQLRSLGGKWIVLLFFASTSHEDSRKALDKVLARRAMFDDVGGNFFGVSVDPTDRSERGLTNSVPGIRYFWDFDRAVSRLYGCQLDHGYAPAVFLLDPTLRIAAAEPMARLDAVLDLCEAFIAREPPSGRPAAPVLTAPRILEPELCQALVDLYEQSGGKPSGFMRAIDGKTVAMLDGSYKKRNDLTIEDEALRHSLRWRLNRRLVPLIEQAFCWKATRIERYIVARYGAEDGGFFSAHRDNTTPGTAHRRFAVTINLNDDFDGGELRFPEYGDRTFRPPVGGATVFSCSLLHEATPVTRGVRFATLPFLYDDAGAALREAARDTLSPMPVSPDGAP